MSYEITDEEIAKIEEICRREIGLHKNYSQRDILALISRLRAAEAKLNSICVELPIKYQDDEGYTVYQACDVVEALTAAGVNFK